MEVKRTADVPDERDVDAGSPGRDSESYGYAADIRESASVAHIYGQNLVAAESLTAGGGAWHWSPETLKPTADKELRDGTQPLRHPHFGSPAGHGQDTGPRPWAVRPVVHPAGDLGRASRKPVDSAISREAATCSSRVSSLPTSSTSTARTPTSRRSSAHAAADVPAGYNFDYVNADALVHRLSVDSGQRRPPPSGHELPASRARCRTAGICRCRSCARSATW